MYKILDGKVVSETIKSDLSSTGIHPKMAIILVGNDVPSEIYVRNKIKIAQSIGVDTELIRYDNTISEPELLDTISRLNNDNGVHGMIVQMPLPKQINQNNILSTIDPTKDIDGLHPYNYGKLMSSECLDNLLIPATPLGITLLLKHYNIETSGKHCVIIGRGVTVGAPLAVLLSKKKDYNMTITLCNSSTKDLRSHTLMADMIICATGRSHLLTSDMVSEGTTVIDVGISRIPDRTKKSGTRLIGDVDFDNVKEKCNYISPVPGGVGPMTIIALMKNLFQAYKNIN
jgi:methylenetetrahydrofolate dehydrogenase (NADP+)/methenyltetrahydrofolate cyclohydrolase